MIEKEANQGETGHELPRYHCLNVEEQRQHVEYDTNDQQSEDNRPVLVRKKPGANAGDHDEDQDSRRVPVVSKLVCIKPH